MLNIYNIKHNLPLILSVLLFSTQGQAIAEENSQRLVQTIRNGGYILYMRHAASNRSQTDIDTTSLNDCSKQRNLSAIGRKQAHAIGESIRTLQIPIGKVITSPYCRCVDTAKLAFGKGIKSNNLRFAISENETKTTQLSKALQKLLSSPPAKGTNTVIVAHTANLKEATKIWPKPEGVLHIFLPLGDKGFKHIGRITPKQWQSLK